MSANDQQLNQTVEQLGRMYRALAALREEVLPANPRNFALLAEGPLAEIRRLQAEVDVLSGRAVVEELEAELWMRIQGPDIEAHEAPTSILTAFLDALRKGVQSVAEFIETGHLTTRPTAQLKQACDLRVVALQPGSLRIGVRLPDLLQLALSDQPTTARNALDEYLRAASWAGSQVGFEELEAGISDVQRRRVVLNALKAIVPRPRGAVDLVELAGVRLNGSGPIRLTRAVNQRIDQAIDKSIAERPEMREGDLREIDLDNRSFILRNVGDMAQIQCIFEEDLLEVAKEALDRRVEVTGIRRVEGRRASVLQVTRLEILDDTETAE